MNIFEQGKVVQSGWAKFENVGDEVQGTYVGKREGVDSYKNNQTIYELMDESGNTILVGVRDTKTPFHDQMKHIRFGQIIGIKFTEKLPPTKPGQDASNILKIWADPKIVNNDWLSAQAQGTAISSGQDEIAGTNEPQHTEQSSGNDTGPTTPGFNMFADHPFVTDEDKIKKIVEVAGTKFGLTDANEIKNRVMETTGLAFIAANLDAIIEKISQ